MGKNRLTFHQLKEQEGDVEEAVTLYLKSGLPAKAALLLNSMPRMTQQHDLVDKVIEALMKSELYEHAGNLHEATGDHAKALQCYRSGRLYAKGKTLLPLTFHLTLHRLNAADEHV